jgi:hypothetical protein
LPSIFRPAAPRKLFLHIGILVFSLLQPSGRFKAAARLSRALAALLARMGHRPQPYSLDSQREFTLLRMLRLLNREGVDFGLEPRVEGHDLLLGGGCLVLTGHKDMNLLALRWAAEQGRETHLVMAHHPPQPGFVKGIRMPSGVILADGQSLLRIRRAVARGGLVALALDTREPRGEALELRVEGGSIFISRTIMQFAERTGIRVLFCATDLQPDGSVTLRIAQPACADAEGMHREFRDFLGHTLRSALTYDAERQPKSPATALRA